MLPAPGTSKIIKNRVGGGRGGYQFGAFYLRIRRFISKSLNFILGPKCTILDEMSRFHANNEKLYELTAAFDDRLQAPFNLSHLHG